MCFRNFNYCPLSFLNIIKCLALLENKIIKKRPEQVYPKIFHKILCKLWRTGMSYWLYIQQGIMHHSWFSGTCDIFILSYILNRTTDNVLDRKKHLNWHFKLFFSSWSHHYFHARIQEIKEGVHEITVFTGGGGGGGGFRGLFSGIWCFNFPGDSTPSRSTHELLTQNIHVYYLNTATFNQARTFSATHSLRHRLMLCIDFGGSFYSDPIMST